MITIVAKKNQHIQVVKGVKYTLTAPNGGVLFTLT